MSSESLHRHHRRCLDAALRRAFSSITDPFTHGALAHLLEVARARSDLLAAAPIVDERGVPHFRQVVALRQLAAWHHEQRGALDAWPGARGHPLVVVDSLARARFGGYRTPRFLASVWFASDRAHQGWWIGHARGVAFRRLPLPLALTRAMEHAFLALPDDTALLPGLRRAEVLGLGGSRALAEAIGATPIAHRFEHGDYWRAALVWMIGRGVEPDEVGALVDFLAAHAPTLSLRGRSLASVRRDVATRQTWLVRNRRARYRWGPSRYQGQTFEGPGATWRVVELCDSTALALEGCALRHCVGGYDRWCAQGAKSIWSLRRRATTGVERSIVTLEVDPEARAIVQLSGAGNRAPGPGAMALITQWAAREGLAITA